jgi:hypothetical protein
MGNDDLKGEGKLTVHTELIVPHTRLLFTGPLGPDGIREDAKPYLIEIGLLVVAWNDLQEKLAELFWTVFGTSNGLVPLTIWHTLRDDRMQRVVLQASIDAGLGERAAKKGRDGPRWLKQSRTKINWLLEEVNTISQDRNNFVHAPFMFSVADNNRLTMVPWDFFGNPRAKALKGKNLMQRHRENMAMLGTYAIGLKFNINKESSEWPTKPRLLSVEEFRRRKAKRDRQRGLQGLRPPSDEPRG